MLDRDERAIVVHELQGDLYFASMEAAFRTVVDDLDATRFVVIDLRRVVNLDGAARSLLQELAHALVAADRALVLAHPAAAIVGLLGPIAGATVFADVDGALEWCEGQVLAAEPTPTAVSFAPLAEQPLLRGLTAAELAAVEAIAAIEQIAAGQTVVREGDRADALYFVLSGRVSVRLVVDGTRAVRLATFGPGMAFGETALVADGVRTADVVTDEPATLARVGVDALRDLGVSDPRFMTTVYENLARQLATWLQRANAQVRALDH